MKRAAVLQDLSVVGKCSLAAAQPIITAAGIECCCVPTAVLSNHTGMGAPYMLDMTPYIKGIADRIKELGYGFDGIYTGYIPSVEGIRAAAEFIELFKTKDGVTLVDPAMADDGELYGGLPPEFPEKMRGLCKKADVILPNYTEACMLAGTPYEEQPSPEKLERLLKSLSEICGGISVITGISLENGTIGEVLISGGKTAYIGSEAVPITRAGTGDIFASVFFSEYLKTKNADGSLRHANEFLKAVMEETLSNPASRDYGADFENVTARFFGGV